MSLEVELFLRLKVGDPATSWHVDTVNRVFSQLRTINSELERQESIILSC